MCVSHFINLDINCVCVYIRHLIDLTKIFNKWLSHLLAVNGRLQDGCKGCNRLTVVILRGCRNSVNKKKYKV